MGLMTFLTGKPRLVRKLEKYENERGNQNWVLVSKYAELFDLRSPEEVLAAASYLNVRFAINQFLTYYLRTRLRHLTFHKKQDVESIFDEECPALVAWIRPHLTMYRKANLDPSKQLMLIQALQQIAKESPDFMSLLNDPSKICSLEEMAANQPNETKRGINIMSQHYRSLCVQSAIDSNPEDLWEFFKELGIIYFPNWSTTDSGMFAVTY